VVAAALAWWTLSRGAGGTSGVLVTENRPVDPFRKLDVTGNMDVTLVPATREEVSIETAPGAQSRVRVRVEGKTLTITGGETRRWWSALIGNSRGMPPPKITVRYRTLEAIVMAGTVRMSAAKLEADTLRIAAAGGSTLKIDDLQAHALKLSGAGALKATLAGKVVDQDISISGAGEVHADQLVSDNASVSVSGAGSIVLRVAKTLRASISGAGSVEYYGDPEVRQQVSGVGRVKRRENARAEGFRVAARPGGDQWSASARNMSGTPVVASRSACTPGSTRTSVTRQSASRAASICTTSAMRSAA
jgi:hypothetical protein